MLPPNPAAADAQTPDQEVPLARPSATARARSMAGRLLALSDEAEEAGSYETAYHLLMAALHAAAHIANLPQVQQVADHALEQERRLEALDPPHPLASTAAGRRGMRPLYRTFQIHADAVRARLKGRVWLDRLGDHAGVAARPSG